MNQKWFVITVAGFFAIVGGLALDSAGVPVGLVLSIAGVAAVVAGIYVHAKEGWEEAAPE